MFKAQVSPLELMQEIEKESKGKFGTTKQEDPVEFLSWLLNRLHVDLGGGRKKDSEFPKMIRSIDWIKVFSQLTSNLSLLLFI